MEKTIREGDPRWPTEKDSKAISEILSSPQKTKIFMVVKKETKPDGPIFISGYELRRIAEAHISTTYGYLDRMVDIYGVFERPQVKRPDGTDAVRSVRITRYGVYIHEMIEPLLPSVDML